MTRDNNRFIFAIDFTDNEERNEDDMRKLMKDIFVKINKYGLKKEGESSIQSLQS